MSNPSIVPGGFATRAPPAPREQSLSRRGIPGRSEVRARRLGEPEPKARWRRRKEARPGEIREAALDCFAERGEFRAIDVEPEALCVIAPLMLATLLKHSLGRDEGLPIDAPALARCHLKLLLRGLTSEHPERRHSEGRPGPPS